jgi:hypothetical protein
MAKIVGKTFVIRPLVGKGYDFPSKIFIRRACSNWSNYYDALGDSWKEVFISRKVLRKYYMEI